MKTRLNKKDCANIECGKEFQQTKPMQKVCSPVCALKYADQKKIDKLNKQVEIDIKQWKRDNKPMSKWIAEAQASVNAYVRLRDHDKGCISCDCPPSDGNFLTGSRYDAGHYRSRGSWPSGRYRLDNIYKQCVRCNRDMSGNHVEFRKALVALKGEEFVLALEHDNTSRKFDREYCERVKRVFNKKTRMKKKRLGLS